MRTHCLGHVVLYVRELDVSVAFYRDLLGLREMGSWPGQAVALSSGRTHHEVLLILVTRQGRSRGGGWGSTTSVSRWATRPQSCARHETI